MEESRIPATRPSGIVDFSMYVPVRTRRTPFPARPAILPTCLHGRVHYGRTKWAMAE